MKMDDTFKYLSFSLPALALLAVSWAVNQGPENGSAESIPEAPSTYIVQADSAQAASTSVRAAGGQVLNELRVIGGVGAKLTQHQVMTLQRDSKVVAIHKDRRLQVSEWVPETYYPALVGAAELHAAGVTGQDVTVAVIDTGVWGTDGLDNTPADVDRIVAYYDTILVDDGAVDDGAVDDGADIELAAEDWSGHGTHVTSVIVGSRETDANRFQGVAPGANVVAVKAFEPDGSGRYIDVIRSIDWVIANKDTHSIRVLNLSFSGNAVSRYWEDPLNQAVMAAWQAGIVVVAAAGNSGPDPMTVGVPGNVPYIITVGAMTDNYTPVDPTDDVLATWSSAGPTFEGFVKPDVVAPGGHMLGIMPNDSWIALEHPQYFNANGDYFTMSGTSQAAAVVSGIVALMLQAEPTLSPDDVKCRLMATARPATDDNGTMAYSVFQQGAGLVDAIAALVSGEQDCANQGMDINLDLAGSVHYGGPAREDENGIFYVSDPAEPQHAIDGSGHTWSGEALWSDGSLWRRGLLESDAELWSHGTPWTEVYDWHLGTVETGGSLWRRSLDEPVSINQWVPQE